MKTLKLWLEPDGEIPRFSRLKWDLVEVSIRDVIVAGIHPWLGHDKHLSVVEAFLNRINDPDAKFGHLAQMSYGYDVSRPGMHGWGNYSPVERMLTALQEGLIFVDDLSVVELMEIAERRLLERWNRGLVREMANGAYPVFQELRQFLKGRDKCLKLSGYADLDRYDLSRVLSLEDFEGHDRLKLSHGIPTLNFRRSNVISDATDSQGRLKLVDEIPEFSLAEFCDQDEFTGLVYRCRHQDGTVHCAPDIGGNSEKRHRAYAFAKKWRACDGRLCFNAPLSEVVRIIETGHVVPSFPTLNYVRQSPEKKAAAVLSSSKLKAYAVGPPIPGRSTLENLRAILREYGVSMTGNKKRLLEKIAKLAASEYERSKDEVESYFEKHHFIVTAKQAVRPVAFPILEDAPTMRQYVIALYILRHLRGNAIVDPHHVNETYTVDDLALALAEKRTEVRGSFLPAL